MILVGIKYKIVKYLMKRGEIDMNINEEFKLEMLEAKDKEVIDSINSYFRENEMNYEVVKLYRKSNRKNELFLYVVVAELANTQRYAEIGRAHV